jgi:hypothetical protein
LNAALRGLRREPARSILSVAFICASNANRIHGTRITDRGWWLKDTGWVCGNRDQP